MGLFVHPALKQGPGLGEKGLMVNADEEPQSLKQLVIQGITRPPIGHALLILVCFSGKQIEHEDDLPVYLGRDAEPVLVGRQVVGSHDGGTETGSRVGQIDADGPDGLKGLLKHLVLYGSPHG